MKYSPRREGLFHQVKDEVLPDSPGIRDLCPTRCTVRASSLKSALLDLWEKAAEIVRDTENILGVTAQMTSFDFL